MQDRVNYEFAIIRLVPKVEREEFINIGVIVYSKSKKFLKMKYVIDENKIKSFSKEIDIPMIKKYLEAWQYICDGSSKGGEIGKLDIPLRFRWLVATRSTIIQSSKTHPGLCIDPDTTLRDLYQNYIL